MLVPERNFGLEVPIWNLSALYNGFLCYFWSGGPHLGRSHKCGMDSAFSSPSRLAGPTAGKCGPPAPTCPWHELPADAGPQKCRLDIYSDHLIAKGVSEDSHTSQRVRLARAKERK